jgi:AcrR family transcriptional regulator
MAGAAGKSAPGTPAPEVDEAPGVLEGRRAAQVGRTRRALLDVARSLFTEHGYQATRTEEVVQRAGVTRGALYHHFRDKEDLFRAVLEEVEAEVFADLRRRSPDGSVPSWELFRDNSAIHQAAASRNPSYRQIVFVDGPAVLGWREWNERRSGPQRSITRYLEESMDQGSIDPLPVEALTQLLAALGAGSTMHIAQAEDPERALAEVTEITDRLLAGLSSSAPERPASGASSTTAAPTAAATSTTAGTSATKTTTTTKQREKH